PEPVYVGRSGLTDQDLDRLLVDWRSATAEPFFAASHGDPRGHHPLGGRGVGAHHPMKHRLLLILAAVVLVAIGGAALVAANVLGGQRVEQHGRVSAAAR
ncbi:hypothetical protein IAE22_33845, partial [Bacillus sp. S34]|nr:hypothetical protein [Bacillus sp. S34]